MRNSLIKTLMVLCAALFFSVQSLSSAHAAAHGDHDHSHDGIACEITVLAAEKVALTPPPAETVPLPRLIRASFVTPRSDQINFGFNERAPPPRGPPLNT